MSSRCQCLFSRPADTILGAHRDPISSEKGWLDFAVRELSRVAAGKARGQEAVWRSQCKPVWWDCVCPHPWKNPTANPKDSKDTLKAKFECLVEHLKKEGEVPREMEEEIALWEAGRVSEVFLMTSFSSLLGQASNLHTVLGDSCHKMENTGISIAPSILTELQSCLSACVDKIDSIKSLATQRNQSSTDSGVAQAPSCSGLKHQRDESNSDDFSQPPCKRPKRSSVSSNLSSSSSSSSSVSNSNNAHLNPEQQKLVLALLQKQLLRKKMTETTATTLPIVQTPRSTTELKAKHRGASSAARSRQSTQKKRAHMLNQGSVGAAVAVSATPLTTLPAAVSEHSVPEKMAEAKDFTDFLGVDLVGNEDGIDFDFWDKILGEKSPNVGATTNRTAVSSESMGLGSTCSVQTTSEMFQFERSPVQTDSDRFNPDPFLCPTDIATEVSRTNPLQFGLTVEAEAGRQSVGGAATISKSLGTTLCADAGDDILSETEVVSDLGYSSEGSSPTSHTSSLDLDEYSPADITTPDFEAFLDSF